MRSKGRTREMLGSGFTYLQRAKRFVLPRAVPPKFLSIFTPAHKFVSGANFVSLSRVQTSSQIPIIPAVSRPGEACTSAVTDLTGARCRVRAFIPI